MLEDMGKKLHAVQDNYDDEIRKLSSGRGNLINSVEKIKKLGAKTTKSLSAAMTGQIEETEETEID